MKTKVALLGESGVGKTSLIRRFVLNEYQESYLHTVGTRVSKIELTVPYGRNLEVRMDMSLFDIMGQRGFQDLVRETYFHGSQGLLAVCDITRRDSLAALDDWIPSALEVSGDVPVFLLVNKKDLADRRTMTEEEVQKIAQPFGAPVVYTSAKTGDMVEDAFNGLAIEIVDRAMRAEQARAASRGLREKILVLLAKRAGLGLTKVQFFEIVRGVAYDDLARELQRLEAEGLVTIMWKGPADFSAAITPQGIDASREVDSVPEG